MKENKISPGLIVYTCLIQASIKSYDFVRTINLFEMMKNEGVVPDHVVYNTIINTCIYNYDWDLTYKYTVESFEKNIKLADDIYKYIITKMISKHCNLKRSIKFEYITMIVKLLKEKKCRIRK